VRSAKNRRRVLVLADQAASSLSNVLVAVLVARSFPDDAEPFAAFSLAVMVFQFTVGSVRGLIFEPELSLHGDRDAAEVRHVMPSYIGATVLVGGVVAIAIAVAAAFVGGMAGSALAALAVVLPLVLVQDAWRYVFIVGRPAAALAIDLVWLTSSCVAILLAPEGVSVAWYVLAWGAGGIAGAVVATALGRLRPVLSRPWAYLVEHRDLGLRFLGEFAAGQAAFYIALLSCGWILGLTAYGAVRGAFLFIGPLQMLAAAVIMTTLPEARRVRDQPDRVVHLVRNATLLVCGATVAWTAVGLALPDAIGEAIIGATWAEAQRVLLPLGLTMIGMSIVACALVGVRAFDGTKGFGARMQSIPFQLACPVTGALVGDLTGFVVGLAVGYAVSAAIWLATLERVRRSVSVPGSVPEPAVVGT
jgi:hypothetical protein